MIGTLLLYAEQLALYHLGAFVCFDRKARVPLPQLAGGVICLVLAVVSDVPDAIVAYLTPLVVVFFAIDGLWRMRILHVAILFVMITGMEEMTEILRTYYLELPGNGSEMMVLDGTVQVLFLLGIYFVRRKHGDNDLLTRWMGLLLPFLMLAVIMTLFLTIVGLSRAYEMVDEPFFRDFVEKMVPAAFVSVWLLSLFVFYIMKVNEDINEARKRERELYVAQKNYYELLLRREEDTKQFRHDLQNHFVCLQELAGERDWEKLEAYLGRMRKGFSTIAKKKYDSGNNILDALTSHLLSGIGDNVEVGFSARLTGEISVDQMSLCAIYSNLLKNAVEALEKCDGREACRLNIEVLSNEKWIKIAIDNSVGEDPVDLSGTSKPDKEHHGYGIGIVREQVGRCGGELTFSRKGNMFCVRVTLPNGK